MRSLLALTFLCWSVMAAAAPIIWFPELQPFPHSTPYSVREPAAVDYLLGLGALQKIGGRWRLKHEESVAGQLARYTWLINEGYTAREGLAWLREQLAAAQLLFECEGRSCGSSAQWANRIFQQRVLFGHDERQQYVVLRLEKEQTTYTLVLYASDRANSRHYVHMDVLRHD